jgi:hypothetical protein
MFDIAFICDEPEVQEEGWFGLWGEIVLGAYRERFLAPLDVWSRRDYERQWIEAANRLMTGDGRTAFVTVARQFWWTMWREQEAVFVHEEMLTPERYARSHGDRVPYELIEDRRTVNEEGEPIAEWRVSIADIRDFVERRAGQYVPA